MSQILRKSAAIEDLFYSSKNKVAVEEELAQFNDILKLVVAAHKEFKQYMEEEEINNSDKWLDEVDERVNQVNLQDEVQNRAVQVGPNQTG